MFDLFECTLDNLKMVFEQISNYFLTDLKKLSFI